MHIMVIARVRETRQFSSRCVARTLQIVQARERGDQRAEIATQHRIAEELLAQLEIVIDHLVAVRGVTQHAVDLVGGCDRAYEIRREARESED